MEKAVMISIKPEWCEKILIGKKTVEIRKTFPHGHMPFKCYIYCTKAPHGWVHLGTGQQLDGRVIGEFVCDRFDVIRKRGYNHNYDYCYLSLNVFGNDDIESDIMAVKKSCVKKDELNKYGKNSSSLYCWHISNLKTYDIPKELSEFKKANRTECFYSDLGLAIPKCRECKDCNLKRAPQSWMYVEDLNERK